MTHLQRVANEIKNIGLYDLVLQDVQKIAQKTTLSEDEILNIMEKNPQILEDYKQINVEYNLSNIHLKDINIDNLDESCKKKAQRVNSNLTANGFSSIEEKSRFKKLAKENGKLR